MHGSALAIGRFPGSPQKVCLPDCSVALDRLFTKRITVAGTAQVFNLIPFSCTDETPMHHQFGCKDTHNFYNYATFSEKNRNFAVSYG
jgi:hypothetical protein